MDLQLVTIATSYDVVEAEFLRNHLEQEGFEVYLADEHIVGAYNLLANAVGGIKIRVPSNEAAEAAAFVEALRNAEIVGEEFAATDNGYGECGHCQSRDLTLKWEKMGIKGILLYMGMPVGQPKRKLHCNRCGAEWNYE